MDQDKIKMKLNIAGESFLLTVPFDEQELIRETETNVNLLFKTWRGRFPEKSDRELLAMIAFQYASHYDIMRNEQKKIVQEVENIEQELDRYLTD